MLLRRIILIVVLVFVTASSAQQQQTIQGIPKQTFTMTFMGTLISSQIAAASTNNFIPPVGSLNVGTVESARVVGLPRSGTVSHFTACINIVGNSTGSLVYVFRLGTMAGTAQADTAIVLTIPASAAVGCYPDNHSFTYTFGQGVDIQIKSNATTGNAATTASISFQLD